MLGLSTGELPAMILVLPDGCKEVTTTYKCAPKRQRRSKIYSTTTQLIIGIPRVFQRLSDVP